MDDGIQIKPLEAWHIDEIYAIEQMCFSVPWSRSVFESVPGDANALYYSALSGETVVGFAGMSLAGEEAEIHNIAVLPGWRRRRVGERLMTAMLANAAGRGVKQIFLEVRSSDAGAQAFYERLGFARIAIRRNYYDKPREDAVIMRLSI